MTHTIDTPTVVTSGLPYANGDLHIGHLRGLFAAETYAAAIRSIGGDAVAVSGTDIHGTPIAANAEQSNTSPRTYALDYHEQFNDTLNKLGCRFETYTHSGTKSNTEHTKQLIRNISERGYIQEVPTRVAVDETGETLPDRFVRGECPNCGSTARGDECEECESHLEPGDVENPRQASTGVPVEYETRQHYHLDLPALESEIQQALKQTDTNTHVTERVSEWLNSGLDTWCISRDLQWGVEYPDTARSYSLYVWIDALCTYLTAASSALPHTLWGTTGDESYVHLVGKDITHHHAVLWPGLLLAGGYTAPDSIQASGFVSLDGDALSTSRDHAVWAREYLDSSYPPEFLRYYLLAEGEYSSDIDFSWDKFKQTISADLVNTLGNFLYRTLSLAAGETLNPARTLSQSVGKTLQLRIKDFHSAIESYQFRSLATTAIETAAYGNKLLQNTEPWNLGGDEKRAALTDAVAVAQTATSLTAPVTPTIAKRSWDCLDCTQTLPTISNAFDTVYEVTSVKKPVSNYSPE